MNIGRKLNTRQEYRALADHYDACLNRYGDTHLGVDWPVFEDTLRRHQVMSELIIHRKEPATLLDFGCGASHFLDFIEQAELSNIDYHGLDISEKFITLSQKKFPHIQYYQKDVLDKTASRNIPNFDYVVANGVLTEKRSLTFDEMWDFAQKILQFMFEHCRIGIAFNAMSTNVDWQRDDLFHLPLDLVAEFASQNLSRHYVIRNDYGLYESTIYVYREANTRPSQNV